MDKGNIMGVFSFRAECTHDTIAFKQCCIDAGIDVGLQINMTHH
jgi:hypothetical protein